VKLKSKLNILLVLVILASTVGAATAASIFSHRIEMNSLEAPLRSIDLTSKGNPNEALTSILNLLQSENVDATVDIVNLHGRATRLLSSSTAPKTDPTTRDAQRLLDQVGSSSDVNNSVYTALNIGADQYAVIILSTLQVQRHQQELEYLVGAVSLVLSGIFVAAARRTLRSDLLALQDLEHYASEVTRGELDTPAPNRKGSAEIANLQREFGVMVTSLKEKLLLEQSSREMMQRFVDDASHELRTPLTVIKGFNELLLTQEGLGEEELSLLATSASEISRMERLISDLLYLARVGEGREIATTPLDVVPILRSELHRFEPLFESRVVQINAPSSCFILGDEEILRKIFSNAFSNICRYTRLTDDVAITVERTVDVVIVTVDDSGPGLPKYEVVPTRFERFDDVRSRSSGGAGLGMSIMYEATRAIGGQMVMRPSNLGGLSLEFRFRQSN